MPIQNGSYVSPTWQDYGPPSMDAAEMQAISDTTEQTQNDKADIDSPALTGTPTVPNPTDGDNSKQIATTAFARASAAIAYPTDTASGSVASFADGADNIPVKSLVVQINAPAGVTGTNIYVTGANVWDEEWENGAYDASGLPIDNANKIRNKTPISVKAGESYYLVVGSSGGLNLYYYDKDNAFISATGQSGNGAITIPSSAAYLNFSTYGSSTTTYNHDISINYPSTDTAYHAYAGAVYAVDWTSEAGAVTTGTLTYKGSGTWEIDNGVPVELSGPDPATLLGDNNAWADCGPVVVQYRADTALYIDKIINS